MATSISFLVEVLGRAVVAVILDQDVDAVARFSANPNLSDEQQSRVRVALHVVRLLLTQDAPSVVRSWFMSMNALLDDQSPAEMLSSGRSFEVEAAATAFAE
jgi:hypothetical protein